MRRDAANRHSSYLICAALVLATYVSYGTLGENGFVALDDKMYVVDNAHVMQGLSWPNARWALTALDASNWHPVTWMSHMLDIEMFGPNPAGHHWTSWALHVANALLLFLVLQQMTLAPWPSAFVAAVFALHPLNVESVAWVAQRKTVLSTLFWLLTMTAYVRYTRNRSRSRFAVVFASLALGLMAKPMLVTLPFVLLLLDYWPLGRFGLDDARAPGAARPTWLPLVREKLPLFLLVIASSLVTYLVQQLGGATGTVDAELGLRLSNAAVSYVTYALKTLWPTSLAVVYPFPIAGLPPWKTFGAVAILLAVTTGVLAYGRERRYLPVGWLWYLGTLVPVIGLVQVGYQAGADRYTYVPSIGLTILVAWGAADLVGRFRIRPVWVTVFAGLALAVLMLGTRAQVRHWQTTFALYEHAARVTDGNYVVLTNLGVAYASREDLDRALVHLERAVETNPDFGHGNYNLALVYHRRGRLEEAERLYRHTLAVDPGYVSAHQNLGTLLLNRGRFAEAIEHHEEVLKQRPGNRRLIAQLIRSHRALAQELEHQGRRAEAAEHRAEARRLEAL